MALEKISAGRPTNAKSKWCSFGVELEPEIDCCLGLRNQHLQVRVAHYADKQYLKQGVRYRWKGFGDRAGDNWQLDKLRLCAYDASTDPWEEEKFDLEEYAHGKALHYPNAAHPPLEIAIFYGAALPIIAALVAADQEIIDTPCSDGFLPLHWALDAKSSDGISDSRIGCNHCRHNSA